MSFFRSEPMTLCQLILHTESAFNCLIELGYLGKVQFRNIDGGEEHGHAPNNQYLADIRRCHELRRLLEHLETEIKDFHINMVFYPDVDEDEVPQASDLKDLEKVVQQHYEEVTSVEHNIEGLLKQRTLCNEKLKVMKVAHRFLTAGSNNATVMAWSDSVIMNLIHDELKSLPKERPCLSFFCGTIPLQRFPAFEVMLWRITRGNFLLKHSPLEISQKDEARKSQETVRKLAFMLFFVGHNMKAQLAKLCQGFGIQLFQCPESIQERQKESLKLALDLRDMDKIIEKSQAERYRILLIAAADLYIWKVKLKKMLMVYQVLNRMGHVRHLKLGKYLQAECWIPTQSVNEVRKALEKVIQRTSKGNPNSMFMPILNVLHRRLLADSERPTYFQLNRFTQGFQQLIDAYGIAQYQELNPAPYTIVTFPFLFAVMFGDIGHGLIMLTFGCWMLIYEKSLELGQRLSKTSNEVWNILFGGRYIITLMGAFSVYTGFIYNDCFSKSFNIFGSAWKVNYNQTTVIGNHQLQLDPALKDYYQGTPYVMGFDPIWDASGENAITTSNSFKMKLAVILGICQMVFGLILSAFNYLHRKDYMDLVLVFMPQLMFLLSLFAYLVFLILFKWSYYGGHYEAPYNSACAPSILIIFINMLLMKGPETPHEGCDVWMFEYQDVVQKALLTVAMGCIPLLLAGKPIWLMMQRKKIRRIKNEALRKSRARNNISNIRKSLIYNVDSSGFVLSAKKYRETMENEEQEVSELWIHSGIHCIESVLGAVSHTASYLRLWALSLAHDQLSSVLWNMVLQIGLTGNFGNWNSLILAIVFSFWAIMTLAILVVMEGLSAFLHTLRLHWVEFQSKFYAGSGERFVPFKFKQSTMAG
ncbi:V-type proton ATPase 116 kDa subunit a 4 [Stomoxys calcitrans]|uniref:V-type proton ATPase 116 kDa subunit a 4 n=1 Tax=Stomoxys calcitrans TaxID=35570 RepID=UPI0027E30D9E|nr:V-type proton ATPase 116 kDa subunit a 4 [Stomoxys calcitrans]